MKWLVRPLVTVPAPYTHKQHSLCLYINLPNSLRSSPPYIIIFYVFHRKGGKRLIVGYLLKKKTCVRIYSAVQQSWRELLLKQSNRALFEKDLELLVIANATNRTDVAKEEKKTNSLTLSWEAQYPLLQGRPCVLCSEAVEVGSCLVKGALGP